jgi:hypothetical protein
MKGKASQVLEERSRMDAVESLAIGSAISMRNPLPTRIWANVQQAAIIRVHRSVLLRLKRFGPDPPATAQ